MANQEIPNSNGDYIENAQPTNWSKGECVPDWQRTHTEQHAEQYT